MGSFGAGTDPPAGDQEAVVVSLRTQARPLAGVHELRVVPTPRQRLGAIYSEQVDFVALAVRQLGASPRDLEDVVHEVFLVAYRRLDEYDPARPIRAWLFGITRNVVRDHMRRWARQLRREREAPIPASPQNPEVAIAYRRAVSWVELFMAGLGEQMRLVFALSELEGLSAPEIAEALDLKLNTVYSRLRRAREKFAAELSRRGETPEGSGPWT